MRSSYIFFGLSDDVLVVDKRGKDEHAIECLREKQRPQELIHLVTESPCTKDKNLLQFLALMQPLTILLYVLFVNPDLLCIFRLCIYTSVRSGFHFSASQMCEDMAKALKNLAPVPVSNHP